MVSYHVKYQKKTNDPIFEKLSDGQTDRQTDRQRDRQMVESDFIGCCPTNVEHPIDENRALTNQYTIL